MTDMFRDFSLSIQVRSGTLPTSRPRLFHSASRIMQLECLRWMSCRLIYFPEYTISKYS